MNNVQLLRYIAKRNLPIQIIFDIIDYWYEWCFRQELYERLIKRYHLDNR